MVGPLKRVPGGYTHLLVTVDKFTKWIKAQPIYVIKSEQAGLFFLDIAHHFGVPNSIITDKDTIHWEKFLRFYNEFHIHVVWATVAHPT